MIILEIVAAGVAGFVTGYVPGFVATRRTRWRARVARGWPW